MRAGSALCCAAQVAGVPHPDDLVDKQDGMRHNGCPHPIRRGFLSAAAPALWSGRPNRRVCRAHRSYGVSTAVETGAEGTECPTAGAHAQGGVVRRAQPPHGPPRAAQQELRHLQFAHGPVLRHQRVRCASRHFLYFVRCEDCTPMCPGLAIHGADVRAHGQHPGHERVRRVYRESRRRGRQRGQSRLHV